MNLKIIDGFFYIGVELHGEGSATNGATLSNYKNIAAIYIIIIKLRKTVCQLRLENIFLGLLPWLILPSFCMKETDQGNSD